MEEAFIELGEEILEEAELVGGEDGLVEGVGEVATLVHVEQLHEVADAVDHAGVGTDRDDFLADEQGPDEAHEFHAGTLETEGEIGDCGR